MGGEHPANPYVLPADWIAQQHRIFHDEDPGPLILYPWFRRQLWGMSGKRIFRTTLAQLAGVPAYVPPSNPERAADEAARIDSYRDQLQRGRGVIRSSFGGLFNSLHLTIADGATVPDAATGKNACLFEAYRREAWPSSFDFLLSWPHFHTGKSSWTWWKTMTGGGPTEIEAAFRGTIA